MTHQHSIHTQPAALTYDTPSFLIHSALTVAHSAALGALEGCTFGADGTRLWGDPEAFTAHLLALYERPEAEHLHLIRYAWQATAPTAGVPGIGLEGLWTTNPDWVKVTAFERCGGVLLHPGATAGERPAEETVLDEVLGELVVLTRAWLLAHPFTDGLGAPAADSVARSAEFAWVFLNALGQAVPGQALDLPDMPGPDSQSGGQHGARQASEARRRVALGLAGQGKFTRLSARERQALSELLVLMPAFLAGMYEYARLAEDTDSQEMCVELANDYLTQFFGVPPHRTEFSSPTLHGFGWP